jgi:LuxR family maltose regulon positive regulatory protein
MVDRPRIRRVLDAGSDAVLTLVAAPAGYGKTTAVRLWCESRDATLVWVTLDADDNDPARLWRYLATACDPGWAGLRCSGSTWQAVRSRTPWTSS